MKTEQETHFLIRKIMENSSVWKYYKLPICLLQSDTSWLYGHTHKKIQKQKNHQNHLPVYRDIKRWKFHISGSAKKVFLIDRKEKEIIPCTQRKHILW